MSYEWSTDSWQDNFGNGRLRTTHGDLHGDSIAERKLRLYQNIMTATVAASQEKDVRFFVRRNSVRPFTRLHAHVLDNLLHSIWKRAEGE